MPKFLYLYFTGCDMRPARRGSRGSTVPTAVPHPLSGRPSLAEPAIARNPGLRPRREGPRAPAERRPRAARGRMNRPSSSNRTPWSCSSRDSSTCRSPGMYPPYLSLFGCSGTMTRPIRSATRWRMRTTWLHRRDTRGGDLRAVTRAVEHPAEDRRCDLAGTDHGKIEPLLPAPPTFGEPGDGIFVEPESTCTGT